MKTIPVRSHKGEKQDAGLTSVRVRINKSGLLIRSIVGTSHRKVEREVKGGKGFRARVGNMSSGTCMREEGAKSACGPKLND
jgi:hypothetical protein